MKNKRGALALGALFLAILVFAPSSFASTTGLPMEDALSTLQKSLTGPIAKGVAVLAFFVAGGMLAYGGEIGSFTKTMLWVVVGAAVLVGAGSIVDTLFSVSSAVV